MRLFKDTNGREWEISLTIASARKLNERLKPYELDLLSANALIIKMQDVFFVADLLYLTVQDQAQERNISPEEFGNSLAGDILFNAQQAFLDEYLDFFPDPTARENIRAVLEKGKEYVTIGGEAIRKEMEKELNNLKSFTTSSSNSPDNADSPNGKI